MSVLFVCIMHIYRPHIDTPNTLHYRHTANIIKAEANANMWNIQHLDWPLLHSCRYHCEVEGCGFSTNRHDKLDEHADYHSDSKQFRCTYAACYYASAQPKDLATHMQVSFKHNSETLEANALFYVWNRKIIVGYIMTLYHVSWLIEYFTYFLLMDIIK